jgi:chromosome segregation ATPase
MREEQEEKTFNPVKFGLIGALLVAAVVAFLLWLQSYNQTIEALKAEQASTVQQLEKAKKENEELQNKLVDLTSSAAATSSQFKKQLMQRETQLSTIKREKEAEARETEAKLSDLAKEKSAAQAEIAKLKKDTEEKTQSLKKLQEQIGKGQLDLQKVRIDLERAQKSYDDLQRKIHSIEEGDQSAADEMVQQLAEARRQLRQEKEARRRLEEELDMLKGAPPPPNN